MWLLSAPYVIAPFLVHLTQLTAYICVVPSVSCCNFLSRFVAYIWMDLLATKFLLNAIIHSVKERSETARGPALKYNLWQYVEHPSWGQLPLTPYLRRSEDRSCRSLAHFLIATLHHIYLHSDYHVRFLNRSGSRTPLMDWRWFGYFAAITLQIWGSLNECKQTEKNGGRRGRGRGCGLETNDKRARTELACSSGLRVKAKAIKQLLIYSRRYVRKDNCMT